MQVQAVPIRQVLEELGGVATSQQLHRVFSRREVSEAVAARQIVRARHGMYALDAGQAPDRVAAELGGALVGPSAALHHRWKVLVRPELPWVGVPRHRKIGASHRRRARVVHRAVEGTVTPPVETVLDCARWLGCGEALAIADSALRAGLSHHELQAAASAARGPGSAAVRKVAEHASPLADSPLESALRALCLDVADLHVRPQVPVELPDLTVHPDLVDERLRLVVEADTWAFHGADPAAFNRDLERYTLLVSLGWTVLRFCRQDVVDRPDWTTGVLARTVALSRR